MDGRPADDGRSGRVGSIYVSVVLLTLVSYLAYQSWFNPQRAIKRQLGELAAALSSPPSASPSDASEREIRLRQFFAPDARVRLSVNGPVFATRDEFVAALGAWEPTARLNVEFVDVQVALDSSEQGRAYLTVELTGLDSKTGAPGRDSREARVSVAKQGGAWVVTSAEPADSPAR